MKQIAGNAVRFQKLTFPTALTISATRVTENDITCNATATLKKGMPVVLLLDGGTAGGITDSAIYWVVAIVDATHFQVSSKFNGTAITISADAGAGDIQLGMIVRGNVWVNTAGFITVMGPENLDQTYAVLDVEAKTPFPGYVKWMFNYNPELDNATSMASGLYLMAGFVNSDS